jgi:hypothetical protein
MSAGRDDYMGSKYSKQVFKEGSVEESTVTPEQEQYDNLTKDIFWKEHVNEASTFDKKQTLSICSHNTVRGEETDATAGEGCIELRDVSAILPKEYSKSLS